MTLRSLVRIGMSLLAATTAILGLGVMTATPGSSTAAFSFTRVAGTDRYDTAGKVAAATFPSGAVGAILANGSLAHFPDALAAGYLAGYYKVPILLTDVNSVPAGAMSALQGLHVKSIAVVGGTAAVGGTAVSQLTAAGYQVARVAGATRYDTAQAIAAAVPSSYVGKGALGLPTAVVASGANFPDALVSGPMAYGSAFPVEITDPAGLSPQTQQSLQALGIRYALIAGGTAAVSSAVETQLTTMGIVTKRFAGADRTDTAAQVAAYEVQSLGFSKTGVDLARGDDPADSLASGPFGGTSKVPLLLTANPTTLGTFSTAFLTSNAATLTGGVIFGGTAAVSQAVQDQATAAARGVLNTVAVTAAPATVPAVPLDTSTLTVVVTGAGGTPTAADPVTFSTSGSPAAACGTVAPPAAVTDATGHASAVYAPSTTAGTCTVTATEANSNGTGSVVITQTGGSTKTLTVSASPSSVTVAPSATSTSTLSATVMSNGAPVVGDTVSFTDTPSTAGSCGTIVPPSEPTAVTGQATAVYTASSVAGSCTVTATDGSGGPSASVTILQTAAGGGGGGGTFTVAVAATTSTIPVITGSTTITATVTKGGATVANDPVVFTTTAGAATPGSCGVLVPAGAVTDATGKLTASYNASVVAGQCTIKATEASGGTSGSTVVTQA